MINRVKQLLQKKIIRDAFALYIGKGLNLSLGIISTIIYGAIFQTSQIALISLFEMIVNLFISFGFTWSTTGIVRFGRENFERDRSLSYVSSTRFSLILPLLLFTILTVFLFQDEILVYIGSDNPLLIYFILLNIVLMVAHEHINSLFNAAEKHVANVVFQVAHSLSKLIVLLLFIEELLPLDALTYIYLSVIVLGLLLLIRLPFLEKKYIFPIICTAKKDFLAYLKFVAPQIYGFAGTYLINWMDLYFLRQNASYEELGAYQFLYSIFLKITSFALMLNILFFPRIMSWKESNQKALEQYIKKFPITILIVTFVGIGFILQLYEPFFNNFFNDKYVIAYQAFNLMLISVPFFFISFLFIPVLNSYDKVIFIQIVNLISALGNLLIDYFLIKKFGLIAAAFGTYVAYLLQFQLLTFGISKIFTLPTTILSLIGFVTFTSALVYFLINIY
jgi:O-antigen/teichoic acid export membrane protein